MKPEVAESKIDSFSKERIFHDGESIEGGEVKMLLLHPYRIITHFPSLVTNRRVIVIVKLAILAVFTRREREREKVDITSGWSSGFHARVEIFFAFRNNSVAGIFSPFNLFIRWLDKWSPIESPWTRPICSRLIKFRPVFTSSLIARTIGGDRALARAITTRVIFHENFPPREIPRRPPR